jgi:hypothetical protein
MTQQFVTLCRTMDLLDGDVVAIDARRPKLYVKDKQPIAFASRAMVPDEIKAGFFRQGRHSQRLPCWHNGTILLVVNCISPFNDLKISEIRFLNAAAAGCKAKLRPHTEPSMFDSETSAVLGSKLEHAKLLA